MKKWMMTGGSPMTQETPMLKKETDCTSPAPVMVVNATTSERLQTEPGVQSLWEAETVGRELRCLFHEQNKGHMMVCSLLFEVVMGQPILIHTHPSQNKETPYFFFALLWPSHGYFIYS